MWFGLLKRLTLGRWIALTAALAAVPFERSPAFAGSFTLFEGEQYELCREYARNLAAFPDLTDKTYEWPLDPKLKDFTKPRWEAVDVQQHMDIVKTFYLWYEGPPHESDPEPTWQSKSAEFFADLARHIVRLDTAKIDFNHTGNTDTVYRLFHELSAREKANSSGTQVAGYWYIYKSSMGARLSDQFRAYAFFDSFFDSFLFKGRFYLIDLGTFGRDLATTLTVREPTANVERLEAFLKPVCRYRYRV